MPDASAQGRTSTDQIVARGAWGFLRRKILGWAGAAAVLGGGAAALYGGLSWIGGALQGAADARWVTATAWAQSQTDQDAAHAEARAADAATTKAQIDGLSDRIVKVETGLAGVQGTLTKLQIVQAVDLCRKARGRVILRITEGVQICRFGRRPGDDDVPLSETDALIDRAYGG